MVLWSGLKLITGAVCLYLVMVITVVSIAEAQQLLQKMTLAQCNAMGGRILSYTNTAGRGPDVGECYVPAKGTAGAGTGAYSAPSAAGNAAAALGVASGVLGLIEALPGLAPPSDAGLPAENQF